MNRKYTREWYLDASRQSAGQFPDCGISTDLFTGFHDESEEDFLETLSLMREVGFDSSFMFKYSERPGTLAARTMPDNITEEVKIDRLNRMIAVQNELSRDSNARDVGKTFDVLVEGVSKRSREQFVGRNQQNKTPCLPPRRLSCGRHGQSPRDRPHRPPHSSASSPERTVAISMRTPDSSPDKRLSKNNQAMLDFESLIFNIDINRSAIPHAGSLLVSGTVSERAILPPFRHLPCRLRRTRISYGHSAQQPHQLHTSGPPSLRHRIGHDTRLLRRSDVMRAAVFCPHARRSDPLVARDSRRSLYRRRFRHHDLPLSMTAMPLKVACASLSDTAAGEWSSSTRNCAKRMGRHRHPIRQRSASWRGRPLLAPHCPLDGERHTEVGSTTPRNLQSN